MLNQNMDESATNVSALVNCTKKEKEIMLDKAKFPTYDRVAQ